MHTGETDENVMGKICNANLILTTPEKWDAGMFINLNNMIFKGLEII